MYRFIYLFIHLSTNMAQTQDRWFGGVKREQKYPEYDMWKSGVMHRKRTISRSTQTCRSISPGPMQPENARSWTDILAPWVQYQVQYNYHRK